MNKKYKKTLEIYKIFAGKGEILDFSEKAKQEIYLAESLGKGNCTDMSEAYLKYLEDGTKINGFAIGKRNMDITVNAWFEDFKKHGWYSLIKELYEDQEFPHWWLNKIFKKFIKEKNDFYKETL